MIQRIPVMVTARSPLIDHTDFHLTDGCRTYTSRALKNGGVNRGGVHQVLFFFVHDERNS